MGRRLKDARKFIRKVRKQSTPDPIYFVYGDEPYMLDQAVEAIIDTAAPDGTNDFNFDKFRGSDARAEQIRESAEMLPMMVDRRVVLVRNLQEMPISEFELLKDYFEDPAETTCLVLHGYREDAGDMDFRKGAFRALKKAATCCEFESLYDGDAEQVVRKQAGNRGLQLGRQARAYLVEAVGTDIATINQALDKIDLYMGESDEQRTVDVESIQEVIAETRVRSVFDLSDALGDRKYQEALTILDRMLLVGESPIRILHMIARHFRIVDKIHDPDYRKLSKNKMAGKLNVPSFFLSDYKRHARTFSAEGIAHIRRRILEVDTALKSSGLDDRTVLEDLLYDICFRDAS
jgi:DNA polymerase-3 subunit delta